MQQRQAAVRAWLALFGQSIGLGGIIFEIGFDRLQHASVLPALVGLATIAVSQDASLPFSSLASSVRRLSLSRARGLEIEMNQPGEQQQPPSRQNIPETKDSPQTANSPAIIAATRIRPNGDEITSTPRTSISPLPPEPRQPPSPDEPTPNSPTP